MVKGAKARAQKELILVLVLVWAMVLGIPRIEREKA